MKFWFARLPLQASQLSYFSFYDSHASESAIALNFRAEDAENFGGAKADDNKRGDAFLARFDRITEVPPHPLPPQDFELGDFFLLCSGPFCTRGRHSLCIHTFLRRDSLVGVVLCRRLILRRRLSFSFGLSLSPFSPSRENRERENNFIALEIVLARYD